MRFILIVRKKTSLFLDLKSKIINALDKHKADNIVLIDLKNKSDLADFMVVASGQSSRHVLSLANNLLKKFKEEGLENIQAEGLKDSNWVVVDTGNIIIHIFIPELREFYNIENMWNHNLQTMDLVD